MMLGTLAQRRPPAQGAPEWVPDGATAFLDFVNGHYFAGGAERAVSTLLGGGFDPAAISGSGMRIIGSNGNRPKAIGALFSDLEAGIAAGCTLLFDLNCANPPGGFLLFIANAANLDLASEVINVGVDGYVFDYDSLGFGDTISTAGVHKEGITINRDLGAGNRQYARSNDGSAATTQTVNYTPAVIPINSMLIGHDGVGTGNSLNDVTIRSITLYPAVSPTALAALTA